jgi:hypothetical protein
MKPKIYTHLNEISQMNLDEYMSYIKTKITSVQDTYYLDKFIQAINSSRNYGGRISGETLLNNPLIYIASHEEIISTTSDYATYIMYKLISKHTNVKTPIIQLSANITCVQSATYMRGPAFFEMDNNKSLLLEWPTKKMLKHLSVGYVKNPKISNTFIEYLTRNNVSILDVESKESLAEIIFYVNHTLSSSDEFNPNFSDDDSIMKMISLLLKEEDMFVSKLFLDNKLLDQFLKIKDKIINNPTNFILRNSTDFFYYSKNGQLLPVNFHYKEGHFEIRKKHNDELVYKYEDRDSFITILQEGNLYPDLITSYLFSCILTELYPLGGGSQFEYYESILNILGEFLELDTEFDSLKYKVAKSQSILIMGLIDRALPNTEEKTFAAFEKYINYTSLLSNSIDYDFFDYIKKLCYKENYE